MRKSKTPRDDNVPRAWAMALRTALLTGFAVTLLFRPLLTPDYIGMMDNISTFCERINLIDCLNCVNMNLLYEIVDCAFDNLNVILLLFAVYVILL
jgi:hypothetical protein